MGVVQVSLRNLAGITATAHPKPVAFRGYKLAQKKTVNRMTAAKSYRKLNLNIAKLHHFFGLTKFFLKKNSITCKSECWFAVFFAINKKM